MELYPLKFKPIGIQRIWGGEKLNNLLEKKFSENCIGESWEISGIKDNETVVSCGLLKGKTLKELIWMFEGDLIGRKVYNRFGENFPLLIKFIDAKTPLSIQVHPSDLFKKTDVFSVEKNEMWYVMQADKNAEIINGFNKEVTKNDFITHLNSETLLNILNVEKVRVGDSFFIPAGRIHAIGAGVLLAEIQQSSDVTYRVYDYNRIDSKTGKKRDLHLEEAQKSLDYSFQKNYKTTFTTDINCPNKLIHSPYFKTNFIKIEGELLKDYTDLDSFVIYICVEGFLEIIFNEIIFKMRKGETILIPAKINRINIKATKASVIEVFV